MRVRLFWNGSFDELSVLLDWQITVPVLYRFLRLRLRCIMPIGGFHCHATVTPRKKINLKLLSQLLQVVENEYINNLSKCQVCTLFRTRVIRQNDSQKLREHSMETPCKSATARTPTWYSVCTLISRIVSITML